MLIPQHSMSALRYTAYNCLAWAQRWGGGSGLLCLSRNCVGVCPSLTLCTLLPTQVYGPGPCLLLTQCQEGCCCGRGPHCTAGSNSSRAGAGVCVVTLLRSCVSLLWCCCLQSSCLLIRHQYTPHLHHTLHCTCIMVSTYCPQGTHLLLATATATPSPRCLSVCVALAPTHSPPPSHVPLSPSALPCLLPVCSPIHPSLSCPPRVQQEQEAVALHPCWALSAWLHCCQSCTASHTTHHQRWVMRNERGVNTNINNSSSTGPTITHFLHSLLDMHMLSVCALQCVCCSLCFSE